MATPAHCAYCFETLSASLEKRKPLSLRQVESLWEKYHTSLTTNDALATPSSSGSSTDASAASSQTDLSTKEKQPLKAHPLFVTWNTISSNGERRLRGCIGTFEGLELEEGLSSYALTSAFDDCRFPPITKRELATLSCAVTLLTDFEPAAHVLDWEIGVHGIRIAFSHRGRRYGATYLPDVAKEQGWTKEEALVSLMRKAGWRGREDEWKGVEVSVTRYQGKKVEVDFEEWKEWREWVDEEIADC